MTGAGARLPDVVADNSSSAGFITGSQLVDPLGSDLRLLGVVLEVNGQVVRACVATVPNSRSGRLSVTLAADPYW